MADKRVQPIGVQSGVDGAGQEHGVDQGGAGQPGAGFAVGIQDSGLDRGMVGDQQHRSLGHLRLEFAEHLGGG